MRFFPFPRSNDHFGMGTRSARFGVARQKREWRTHTKVSEGSSLCLPLVKAPAFAYASKQMEKRHQWDEHVCVHLQCSLY